MLPFHFTKIGRWWNKTEELDILALDRTGEHILIGECKYRNTPFPLSEIKKMEQKFQPENQNADVRYYVFSKNGFTDETVKYANENTICMVGLEELCK